MVLRSGIRSHCRAVHQTAGRSAVRDAGLPCLPLLPSWFQRPGCRENGHSLAGGSEKGVLSRGLCRTSSRAPLPRGSCRSEGWAGGGTLPSPASLPTWALHFVNGRRGRWPQRPRSPHPCPAVCGACGAEAAAGPAGSGVGLRMKAPSRSSSEFLAALGGRASRPPLINLRNGIYF